jgi:uncharacterized protein (TIGR02996 family)
MTYDDAFLADIIESPDDDTPRLVYADWLDDHDQPDRAEFIRVQVELARLPDDLRSAARRQELQARERALLQDHMEEWLDTLRPLSGLVYEWQFRRGFIEAISMEGRGLREHGPLLFCLAPIRRLRLYRAREFLGDLTALPQLSQLTRLDLTDNSLNDEAVLTLASCSHLARLNELDLRYNAIGDAAAAVLAESPWLSGLARLNLVVNHIGDAGARALARSLHFPRLASLWLHCNPITPKGRKALRTRFGDRVRF